MQCYYCKRFGHFERGTGIIQTNPSPNTRDY
jgi:hypothetical protein